MPDGRPIQGKCPYCGVFSLALYSHIDSKHPTAASQASSHNRLRSRP